MSEPYRIPVGVIEGFFGRPWSWEVRAAYAPFLRELGFGFYIYAPKDDRYLRQRWREPWPQATCEQAAALVRSYREAGLRFGIGLSPFELHLEDGGAHGAALAAKVRQLNDVGPDILAILFDDMRGQAPDLATRQVRIVDAVTAASTAASFLVCPTYYSFDPLLERVFGAQPEGYLAELGRLLDPRIDIFWTGPQVCSRRYPEDHLTEVAALLRRKPFLWDNYPVNDSAAMAPFLHLGPFRDRPAALQDLIAGHAVNLMNQAWLSRIPLRTLADSYAEGADYDPEASFAAACRGVGDPALGEMLIEDRALFQETGLERLTPEQRRTLSRRYAGFAGNPYADEVLGWLAGDYAFDPDCIT
jgi:hypothetical protein